MSVQHDVSGIRLGVALISLILLVTLLKPAMLSRASTVAATGHFEVYCDGIAVYLAKINDAPAKRKLVLFSLVNFPPGTIGGRYFGQGKWSDILVFPDGCVPDGKCKSIAQGKMWIDAETNQDAPPKNISGKYELSLNGKFLQGTFIAKRRFRRRPLRLCM